MESPTAARRRIVPLALGALFAALWLWAAIDPVDRFDWLLENLLVFLCVPLVVWGHVRRPFSTFSLAMLWTFGCLHVLGSHWSYSNVPWPDWRAMGFERNHYDRVVHFTYGLLLTVPLAELARRRGATPRSAWLLALQFVLATSALYEVIEWGAVEIVNPDLGAAFLGSQGDEFDAVKDMALAGLGSALVAVAGLAWSLRGARASPAPALTEASRPGRSARP